MVTRSPSRAPPRPGRRRAGRSRAAAAAEPAADGERVQQRLRRVLVGPVAGVDHAAAHPVRQPVRGAGGVVPDDDRVGAHRLQRQRGVLQALALGDAGALGGEVDHVGGQPLGRRLERDPGPGGVLEEEVHDRAAAQGRQLLDGAVGDAGQLVGGVEHQQGIVAAQVRRRDQVPVHWAPPAPAGHPEQDRVLAVHLGEQDPDELLLGGGQVLADVVGPDRQLPVAPVDQDGELHGPRPAEVVERVERRPHRPPRVEHVVHQHHDLAVDPVRRHLGPAERPRRAQPEVIAVHGDVKRPVRDWVAFHLLEPGGQAARQRHPAGRDAEQHHLLRAPGPLDDLVGDPGQRPADLGLFQHGLAVPGDGAGGPVPGRLRARRWPGAHASPGPPFPPHGTGLKGCRSGITVPARRPAGAGRRGRAYRPVTGDSE